MTSFVIRRVALWQGPALIAQNSSRFHQVKGIGVCSGRRWSFRGLESKKGKTKSTTWLSRCRSLGSLDTKWSLISELDEGQDLDRSMHVEHALACSKTGFPRYGLHNNLGHTPSLRVHSGETGLPPGL